MSFHTQFPSNLKANTRGRCRSLWPRVVIYGTSDHSRQPPERAEHADSLTGLEDKMPHVQPHHHTSIHVSSCYRQGFTRASPGPLAVPERFGSWLGPTATSPRREGLWGRPDDLYHIFMALWLPSWIGSFPPRTDQRRQFLFSHRHHSGTTSPFHAHHEGFFIFWTVQREINSFIYPQEYYVTQTYLTLGGFHKAIWTSREVDFLENTLLTMQLQENVLKCMYQHLNTRITKCNSSQLLFKIRMNFFLSFFGLYVGGYYVCFNQHRPFDEKDSWHHLLQDSMKTKASSLYLHVGAELIKVSVSVFFNFLWSING